jgi:hypothetical protein
MQCIHCGATLPPNVNFCPACTRPVPEAVGQAVQPVEATLASVYSSDQTSITPPSAPVARTPPAYEGFSFAEFAPPGARPIPPLAPGQIPLRSLPPYTPAKRSRGILIFSVVFIVVLVGALVAAFANLSTHSNSNAQAQHTNITPTPDATQLYTQVINTAPTLVDALNSASGSQWHTNQQQQYQCLFQNGAFHVLVSNPDHYFFCPSIYTNQGSFAFQVQITLVQGDYAGITLCTNVATNALYYLRFNRFESYDLFLYKDIHGADALQLAHGDTASLNGGLGANNVLTVIDQRGHYFTYFNRQFVTQLTNTFLTSGNIGLVAGNDGLTTDAAFSNAKIWDLNS